MENVCHFGYVLHRNADSAEKSLSVNRYIVPEMRLASDPQSSLCSDSPEGHLLDVPKGVSGLEPGADGTDVIHIMHVGGEE